MDGQNDHAELGIDQQLHQDHIYMHACMDAYLHGVISLHGRSTCEWVHGNIIAAILITITRSQDP